MCIAINSKKGTSPTKDQLKESFDSNPHGGGYCFADGKKVVIKKGFFTFEDFYRSYEMDQMGKKDKLIHFRIATHGAINTDNCHPFRITEQIAMIHNGVIDHFGSPSKSDTKEFCELVLKPLIIQNGFEVLKRESVASMLSDSIGNSKLAFINHKGQTVLINEKKGNWFKGVWYSNKSYQKTFNYHHNYGFTSEDYLCCDCDRKITASDWMESGLCYDCEEQDYIQYNGWGHERKTFSLNNKGRA